MESSAVKNRLTERFFFLGVLCVVGLGVAVSISTALVNIFAGLLLLCWLGSGQFKEIFILIKENPVVRAALLLFLVLCLGLLYTSEDLIVAACVLKKYRELFLIVLIMPFMTSSRYRQWGLLAFFAGTLVLLLVSYGTYAGILPAIKNHKFTYLSYITHNVFLAYFAFWAAHRLLDAKNNKLLLWGLLLLIVYNIFFVFEGRTGYVIFFFLAILLCCQRFSWQRAFMGIIVLSALLASLLLLSENFVNRTNLAVSGFKEYIDQSSNSSESVVVDQSSLAIAQRLDFMKNSLSLFLERPVWGYGTGSFAREYAALADRTGIWATDNPHNEYLLIAVQLGAIGLFMFLFLFFVQWRCSYRLPPAEKYLAQGLVVTMVLGCLVNSFLLDFHEGHFYAYFSALLFSSLNGGGATENL